MWAVIEILAHRLLDGFFCQCSSQWANQLFSPQSLFVVRRFLFDFFVLPSWFFFLHVRTRSGRAQTRLSFTVWMLLGRKHFFSFADQRCSLSPSVSASPTKTKTHLHTTIGTATRTQTHTHTHAVDQRNKSLITSTERVLCYFVCLWIVVIVIVTTLILLVFDIIANGDAFNKT